MTCKSQFAYYSIELCSLASLYILNWLRIKIFRKLKELPSVAKKYIFQRYSNVNFSNFLSLDKIWQLYFKFLKRFFWKYFGTIVMHIWYFINTFVLIANLSSDFVPVARLNQRFGYSQSFSLINNANSLKCL